jgi:amino acid adenylation domain-containing protein
MEELVMHSEGSTPTQDGRSIVQLFTRQVHRNPGAVALVDADRRLTYGQLDRHANRFASFLLGRHIGRGDRVAMAVERSPEAFVVLLGILKAGAAYVPLDLALPAARRAHIVRDAGARLIVAGSRKHVGGVDVPSVVLSEVTDDIEAKPEIAPPPVAEDDACCVLYTSGVSGTPKGVVVHAQALLNHFRWMMASHPIGEADVAIVHRSSALMAACWDYFGPLVSGASLVIVRERPVADMALTLRTAIEHNVTHASGTPSFWQGILDQPQKRLRQWAMLRLGITSGEPLSPALARAWRRAFPSGQLLNLYGSTECVRPLAYDVSELPDHTDVVPIGRPVPNVSVFVLDERGQPVPAGEVGELCVGGPCLFRGYLNQPALTQNRFVKNPLSANDSDILFRTGDRARRRADGLFELLGRTDGLVKIRGFRVELGDVEAALKRRPDVQDAAVLATAGIDDAPQLRAYIVARAAPAPSPAQLSAGLRSELPEYMIPTSFFALDRMPMTASGKVDRIRLLEQTRAAPDLPPAPGTIEERLSRIWSDVLHVSHVTGMSNFIELGGHSLLATRVAARVADEFNVDLPIDAFFSVTETLHSMAEGIDRLVAELATDHAPASGGSRM